MNDDAVSERPRVLVVGLDPRSVADVDVALVEAALEYGRERCESMGLDADLCLVAPDEHAAPVIVAQLRSDSYDCVIVGGGIRKPPRFLGLFETVVNLIRHHAPDATIGFNTNPTDSADAAIRCLEARCRGSV